MTKILIHVKVRRSGIGIDQMVRHGGRELRICFGTQDRGGAHGIAQVRNELSKRGHDTFVFCNGVGRDSLAEAGVPFTECDNAEDVTKLLGYVPEIWVSSMDSPGSIGFKMTQELRLRRQGSKVVVVSDYPTSGGLKGEEWPKCLPDVITAGDPVNAEIIRRAWPDFDPDKVIVTGFPAFDRLESVDVEAVRTKTRDQLGISQDIFLATLLTNIEDTVPLALMFSRLFCEGTKSCFSVRPHPAMRDRAPDQFAQLQELLSSFPALHLDSMSVPTADAICASDAVVAPCSTALAEAAMLRIPGINIYPPFVKEWYMESIGGIAESFPLVEAGVITEARTHDELGALLREAKNGKLGPRLRAMQECHFPHNQKSSRRAADLIEACI